MSEEASLIPKLSKTTITSLASMAVLGVVSFAYYTYTRKERRAVGNRATPSEGNKPGSIFGIGSEPTNQTARRSDVDQ